LDDVAAGLGWTSEGAQAGNQAPAFSRRRGGGEEAVPFGSREWARQNSPRRPFHAPVEERTEQVDEGEWTSTGETGGAEEVEEVRGVPAVERSGDAARDAAPLWRFHAFRLALAVVLSLLVWQYWFAGSDGEQGHQVALLLTEGAKARAAGEEVGGERSGTSGVHATDVGATKVGATDVGSTEVGTLALVSWRPHEDAEVLRVLRRTGARLGRWARACVCARVREAQGEEGCPEAPSISWFVPEREGDEGRDWRDDETVAETLLSTLVDGASPVPTARAAFDKVFTLGGYYASVANREHLVSLRDVRAWLHDGAASARGPIARAALRSARFFAWTSSDGWRCSIDDGSLLLRAPWVLLAGWALLVLLRAAFLLVQRYRRQLWVDAVQAGLAAPLSGEDLRRLAEAVDGAPHLPHHLRWLRADQAHLWNGLVGTPARFLLDSLGFDATQPSPAALDSLGSA
jgi:hypothetical protein